MNVDKHNRTFHMILLTTLFAYYFSRGSDFSDHTSHECDAVM